MTLLFSFPKIHRIVRELLGLSFLEVSRKTEIPSQTLEFFENYSSVNENVKKMNSHLNDCRKKLEEFYESELMKNPTLYYDKLSRIIDQKKDEIACDNYLLDFIDSLAIKKSTNEEDSDMESERVVLNPYDGIYKDRMVDRDEWIRRCEELRQRVRENPNMFDVTIIIWRSV